MSFGERFLVEPDHGPALDLAQPWGEGSVDLDVVGGPYRFVGLSDEQADQVRHAFAGSCAPVVGAATTAVETVVLRAAPDRFREVRTRGWEYTMDLQFGERSLTLAGLDLVGRVEWQPRLRGTLWSCRSAGGSFLGAFSNFLRVLTAYRMVELGGALLHSAGLVVEGDAWLCFGHSGAGKTTLARLARAAGLTVLSDDLNAVLPAANGFAVREVPFTGDLGRGCRAPAEFSLGRLLRIEKGATDAVRNLEPAEALASLVACAPAVNGDPRWAGRLVDNLEQVTATVEVQALTFRRHGRPWEVVDQ